MTTEALKINITQRILDLSDDKLLKKIAELLDVESVVGYEMDGSPIYENNYVNDINESLQLFREGKLETYSTDEVRKKIIGK